MRPNFLPKRPIAVWGALLGPSWLQMALFGSKWPFFTRISSLFNVYIIAMQATSIAIYFFFFYYSCFPMCESVGGEPRPKIVSINNLSTIANTEASKTGWLYDLSREIWKGAAYPEPPIRIFNTAAAFLKGLRILFMFAHWAIFTHNKRIRIRILSLLHDFVIFLKLY